MARGHLIGLLSMTLNDKKICVYDRQKTDAVTVTGSSSLQIKIF